MDQFIACDAPDGKDLAVAAKNSAIIIIIIIISIFYMAWVISVLFLQTLLEF